MKKLILVCIAVFLFVNLVNGQSTFVGSWSAKDQMGYILTMKISSGKYNFNYSEMNFHSFGYYKKSGDELLLFDSELASLVGENNANVGKVTMESEDKIFVSFYDQLNVKMKRK